MLALAFGSQLGITSKLFLVAPDHRRDRVAHRLKRPAFPRIADVGIRYFSCRLLKENRSSVIRFGADLKPLLAISELL